MATVLRQTPTERCEILLVGACELALLEAAWEYFVNRPAYEYIFVVDAPSIASVHALPPGKISDFGVVGFLPAPASSANLKGKSFEARQEHYRSEAQVYPLTCALTEIAARYLFTRRWSSEAPKLMMPSQISSMTRILDAVESSSHREMNKTVANANEDNPLRDLLRHFTTEKENTPEKFVSTVMNDLQRLLPSIYGSYTDTRQLIRFAEVLPFPDQDDEKKQDTVFANSYADIADFLDQDSKFWIEHPDAQSLRREYDAIIAAWTMAIPPSGKRALEGVIQPKLTSQEGENMVSEGDELDDNTEHENAITLAQIEFVNRQFESRGSKSRLVFVTTTARIFRAAASRFGAPVQSIPVKIGTRDMFQKAEYFEKLHRNASTEIRLLPLLDPRSLIVGSDFVNFANHQGNSAVDDQSRAISSWVPIFFKDCLAEDGFIDVKRIFASYEKLQGLPTSRRSSQKYVSISDFSDDEFERLQTSWEEYIRLVSTAEGIDRIARKDMAQDVLIMLAAKGSGRADFQELIGRRIDETMSKWLAVVGGNALQSLLTGTRFVNDGFRVAPPLILPSFNGAQFSFFDLIRRLVNREMSDMETHLKWLTKAEPKSFGVDPNDALAKLKTRYIQLLGQAVLFSALDNWDASHRLATQAYALAEQCLAGDPQRNDPRYVSGREAAYLASISLRRQSFPMLFANRTTERGLDWNNKYRLAIRAETASLINTPERVQFHQCRADADELGWNVLRLIIRVALMTSQAPQTRLLNGEYFALQKRAIEILGMLNGNQLVCDPHELSLQAPEPAAKAYALAGIYLRRQIFAISIQLELLVALPMNLSMSILTEILGMYRRNIPSDNGAEANQLLPPSELDKKLIEAAESVAKLESPKFPASNNDHTKLQLQSFAAWRSKVLDDLKLLKQD
jgi:hypothetical protein